MLIVIAAVVTSKYGTRWSNFYNILCNLSAFILSHFINIRILFMMKYYHYKFHTEIFFHKTIIYSRKAFEFCTKHCMTNIAFYFRKNERNGKVVNCFSEYMIYKINSFNISPQLSYFSPQYQILLC